MKHRFPFGLLLAVAFSTLFFQCKEEEDNLITGQSIAFYAGTAESYLQKDEAGAPLEAGVSLDKATFDGLATQHDLSVSLDLPVEAESLTGLKHVMFDWAQHGHEPAKVYDKPHFDVHFYYLTQAARTAIGPFDTLKSAKVPDAKYYPTGYIPTGHVPFMGNHWVNTGGHEFTPQGFDATFIYGSYDGVQTFLEPMITKKFIEDKGGNFETDVPQPATYARTGLYFPTRYGVRLRDGHYFFYMTGFQKK